MTNDSHFRRTRRPAAHRLDQYSTVLIPCGPQPENWTLSFKDRHRPGLLKPRQNIRPPVVLQTIRQPERIERPVQTIQPFGNLCVVRCPWRSLKTWQNLAPTRRRAKRRSTRINIGENNNRALAPILRRFAQSGVHTFDATRPI